MSSIPPFYYIHYMSDRSGRAAKTIRMREDVYHQAKVAAVVSRKSVGQWIEEAVLEKVRREAAHPLPGSEGENGPVAAGPSSRRPGDR